MTSLALASFLSTAGKYFVVAMIYSCLSYGFVGYKVAKRRDAETAQQDAELERLCQEGQWLRTVREQRRCLGGRRVA